jgi:hypothetical protein
VEVVTYPVAEGEIPAGDYILKSIPEGIPGPAPFVKDSHLVLNQVMEGIRQYFGVTAPHVVAEWEEWIKDCPKSDDVNEYIKDFPLHVPLLNKLFVSQPTNIVATNIDADDINNATYITQPVVKMGSRRPVSKQPMLRCDNGRDTAAAPKSECIVNVCHKIINYTYHFRFM